jgi:hypothetical protein
MSTEETKPVTLTIEDLKAHTTRDDVYLLVSGKGTFELFPLGCLVFGVPSFLVPPDHECGLIHLSSMQSTMSQNSWTRCVRKTGVRLLLSLHFRVELERTQP